MARTAAKHSAVKRTESPKRTRLLIATRKGLWTLTTDGARRTWKLLLGGGWMRKGGTGEHCRHRQKFQPCALPGQSRSGTFRNP